MTAEVRQKTSLLEEAARLYVQEGLNPNQIAARLGAVSRSTVARWAVKYDWEGRKKRRRRQEEELEGLLHRIKLRLARMALPEDLEEEGEPEADPRRLNALCRVVAVLSPPASVLLRRLDKEEAEAGAETVEDRMARVLELLEGAGFAPSEDKEQT